MQYLKVDIKGKKTGTVLIDGEEQGKTGKILMLDAGEYEVSLKEYPAVPARDVILKGTSSSRPRRVVFTVSKKASK